MESASQLPSSISLAYVEDLYLDYLKDADSVPPDWRAYFEQLNTEEGAPVAFRVGPSFTPSSVFNPNGYRNGSEHDGARPSGPQSDRDGRAPADGTSALQITDNAVLQERVDQLVRAYRERGHLEAQLDPLGMEHEGRVPELDPSFHGLTEAHLDLSFSTENIAGSGAKDRLTLRQVIERMRSTYCRSIGVEYMHIDDVHTRLWLQERMEATQNRLDLSRQQQLRILEKLTEATVLEAFLGKKYGTDKRFSLEGGESLMPLLELALQKAARQGVECVVLGMAHRGRIDVLVNIIGMAPREVFREFNGTNPEYRWRHGDVKYHLGYSAEWRDGGGNKLQIDLSFNPSHLEFVNPVILGRVRAIQDRLGDTKRERALALMLHGDAAFAGEGISQETLNLANLRGYAVGGTVHVVVNNQIGFTTTPEDGRSSTYCTGVAKLLQAPIFHVNGEDPEAVAQVIELAMDFRAAFKQDVFVDMYCYRRWGHNEVDEPSFTQPLMYEAIRARKSVRDSYLEHLLGLGGVTQEDADALAAKQQALLEDEYEAAKQDAPPLLEDPVVHHLKWHGGPSNLAEDVDTTVELDELKYLLEVQTQLPPGFTAHPRLVAEGKIPGAVAKRAMMARGELPLDWGAGEALAFATLAAHGYRVRLTGQDSERGTFSSRHAVLHDVVNGATYTPLQHLSADQAPVEIYNSPLSEAGVMGFEYGYSVDCLDGLTAWEAQFGDFCNAAQVIIDQFISSAEDKWKYLSGLVLLLPHSFEGIGPEHSSARLERFLALAAADNIQVCNVTTPAQYFHLLRRQVLRQWRKPLVVMTPKNLLRLAEASSTLEDFASGSFQPILPDAIPVKPGTVSQVLVCTGKIYYELAKARGELKRDDVAILRLEQLYPLSDSALRDMLGVYKKGTPVTWVQEEPENMGAWRYLLVRFGYDLFGEHPFSCISRAPSASPATGSKKVHDLEQAAIIGQAFGSAVSSNGSGLQMTAVTKGFAS